MDGVPSVQALRKRIKKGTLRSVRVLHRDSIVVGVELEELARHYDIEQPATAPEAAPAGAEQPHGAQASEPTRQPSTEAEQPANPSPGPSKADSGPEVARETNPGEQPTSGAPGPEESPRSQALETVDMAVQGWREAREALEVARREHREEITRTIASYENQLQLRDQDLARHVSVSEAREARATRWGRVAALGLVLALAAGVQLTEDAGERLSTERVRAGVLDQQKGALEVDLSDRDRALAISEEALAASQDRADGLAARMEGLHEQLDAVLEEREEARAAARAALRAIRRR